MYLGNTLQAAYSSYLLIDSLSASFNGTTTSFALKVNGVAPVPFPLNEQNVLISVGGVPQKPDPTGAEGFKFSGTNIVFSSAPKTGEAFWGVVLAGADYVNVGVTYPDGTAATPSITFNSTKTTGLYLAGSSTLGFTTAGVLRSTIDSNGNFSVLSAGSATAPSVAVGTGTTYTPGIYSPGTDQLAISTSGTGRVFVDANGNIGVGTTPTNISTYKRIDIGVAGTSNGLLTLRSAGGAQEASIGCSSAGLAFTTNSYATPFDARASEIIFGTGSSGSERMRITSTGLLGLGTSSPGYLFTVSGGATSLAANQYLRFGAGLFASSDGSVDNYLFTGSSGLTVRNNTDASSLLKITNAGLVGIGTTSPNQALEVVGSQWLRGSYTASTTVAWVGNDGGVNPGRDFSIKRSAVSTMSVEMSGRNAFNIVGNTGDTNCYFTFSPSGSGEAARIDSSGRLLVGTTSDFSLFGSPLQVINNSGQTVDLGRFSNDTSSPELTFAKGRGSSPSTRGIVQSGDPIGKINFRADDGSSLTCYGATISAWVDATPGANDMPGRLVFSTTADGASSPTERMRITNGGYIKASNTGVYTDAGGGSRATNSQHFFRSDQNGLTIQATNTNLGSGVEGFTSDFATGATGTHFIGAINLVRTFIVYANGNVANTNNSYGAISDIKLKENIVDAKSQWNDLKALQVRNYNLKEGRTHTQIGLIAQEVELVSPGLVNESPDLDKDGVELGTVTKRVNYSVLYMKAVKALQEAMERIETLEAKVAALESA